ncbi:hypothetical protein [Janthinobacterium sp. CG_S6]|uniref:hypothetical protein n=1 Tax=unclassified Janthinobacterium TaxID=2610881 RepID=UPI00034AE6BD|nr:NAD-dependent SIR2 family protein deacetylase [Janthinobacterium sp. CG_S6]
MPEPTKQQQKLQRAADLIAQADALVVAAGAGIGVDSGLPGFRRSDGFWQAYPARARARMAFARIASPQAFYATPALAWGLSGLPTASCRTSMGANAGCAWRL